MRNYIKKLTEEDISNSSPDGYTSDMETNTTNPLDILKSEYNITTEKGAVFIQIKNNQDFAFKVVADFGVCKIYKGFQGRRYLPVKYSIKKIVNSMQEVADYIKKYHNDKIRKIPGISWNEIK